MTASDKNTNFLLCYCSKDECEFTVNFKACYHSMFFYNNYIGGQCGSLSCQLIKFTCLLQGLDIICYQRQLFECDVVVPSFLIVLMIPFGLTSRIHSSRVRRAIPGGPSICFVLSLKLFYHELQ